MLKTKNKLLTTREIKEDWNDIADRLLDGECITVLPPLKVTTKADLRQRELLARSTI